MQSILSRGKSAKARFAAVKRNGGIMAALRSPSGVIDLASIMVGVLVIGIIGGVIAATVFAVIPWSQDEAAKGALDSVRTAESVQYTMSSGEGNATYLDLDGLVAADYIQDTAKVYIGASATDYTAVVRSDSGKYYSINAVNPANPVEYANLAAADTALTTAAIFGTGTLAWSGTALTFTPEV